MNLLFRISISLVLFACVAASLYFTITDISFTSIIFLIYSTGCFTLWVFGEMIITVMGRLIQMGFENRYPNDHVLFEQKEMSTDKENNNDEEQNNL